MVSSLSYTFDGFLPYIYKISLKNKVLFFSVISAHCLNGLDRLVGPVVKASASRSGFESRLRRDFSGSSHTSDVKTGTPVATLPGAWRHRVSAGTGWPSVSIL